VRRGVGGGGGVKRRCRECVVGGEGIVGVGGGGKMTKIRTAEI